LLAEQLYKKHSTRIQSKTTATKQKIINGPAGFTCLM